MQIKFSKKFQKDYRKLPNKLQKQTKIRVRLFAEDRTHPQLNNHGLHGTQKGFWSINISGDARAIYEWTGVDSALFIKLGTHSQLY